MVGKLPPSHLLEHTHIRIDPGTFDACSLFESHRRWLPGPYNWVSADTAEHRPREAAAPSLPPSPKSSWSIICGSEDGLWGQRDLDSNLDFDVHISFGQLSLSTFSFVHLFEDDVCLLELLLATCHLITETTPIRSPVQAWCVRSPQQMSGMITAVTE